MENLISDVITEYESAVFKSLEGFLGTFKESSIADEIALLNKWLSITVADTSGKKAIGWEISDSDRGTGGSPFDPNFLCEIAYPLPNEKENNLWVRVSPEVKALFEKYLGDYYLGYGNILHYNDILGKYIHMCVDIDIDEMRVAACSKCESLYSGYKNGMPIFPIDVIKRGIPLSQAFLGNERNMVFINWLKNKDKHLPWQIKLNQNSEKDANLTTKLNYLPTNINFVFPNVGEKPMPYREGLSDFINANNNCDIENIVQNLNPDDVKNIIDKRMGEGREPYDESQIPVALAYTLSMFIQAADNYCKKMTVEDAYLPSALGRLTVAFVPVRGHTKKAYQTALLVTIKTPETLDEYHGIVNKLTELSRIIARPLQILESQLVGRYSENRRLQGAHTRTAVGSIMSRNGSHNIGSHVLAALSHNVGTMPDDRVLYQYIQQRMDYIATVTTDFPSWSVSTKFVGDVMRVFFSQRHLLEHISESEGVHAYRFHGEHVGDANNKGAIQIKIYGYKIHRNKLSLSTIVTQEGPTEEFIKYEDDGKGSISLNNDVSIAIPGGIVGQHAFYTIFENFIRNVAKHSWVNTSNKTNNLVVKIAFLDDLTKDNVSFLIWDGSELNEAEMLAEDAKGNNKILSLVNRLQDCFNKSFVEMGRVRQENWGLAEMKISAGYLQKKSIKEIGGIPEGKYDSVRICEIIKPVSVGGRLGYAFDVPRPKDILIVLEEESDSQKLKDLKENPEFISAGISFESKDKVDKTIKQAYEGNGSESLDYAFVVYLGKLSQSIETVRYVMPYRFVVAKGVDVNDNIQTNVATVDKFMLEELIKSNSGDNIVKVRNAIYAAWIGFLKDSYPWGNDNEGRSLKPSTINILVNVRCDSGAEKGLVTDVDVFMTMFSECYHSIVLDIILPNNHSPRRKRIGEIAEDEYYALFVLAQISVSRDGFGELMHHHEDDISIVSMKNDLHERLRIHFRQTIDQLSDLSPVVVACSKIRNKEYNIALEVVPKGKDARGMLVRRLIELQHNGRREERDLCIKFIDFITNKGNGKEALLMGFKKIMDGTGNDSIGIKTTTDIERNLGRIVRLRRKRVDLICDELVDAFESAFLASDVYLRKYEERIVTLPNGYSRQTPVDEKHRLVCIGEGGKTPVARLVETGGHILYRRHDSNMVPNAIYSEALSGSQSYLNSLAQMGRGGGGDVKQLLQLSETGLLRILVLDERADRFLKNHQEMDPIFAKIGIGIVDVEESRGPGGYKNGIRESNGRCAHVIVDGCDATNNMGLSIPQGDFDILIIHQGVIDKWWPDRKHDADGVGEVLENLMKVIPYTVVTTGRGRPDNIPKWAKVLPFSSVESFLFRRYPEKMLLVNTVMSVLPFSDDTEAHG